MVYSLNDTKIHHEVALLDDLPVVDTFLGMLDLKTGCLIIAAICVVHPLVYGCTLFMPMSYLLLTIWSLLGLFFIGSIMLFWAITENDSDIIGLWIWYSVLFLSSMLLLLLMLALIYASTKKWCRVAIVLLGVLWYILTAYFVIVVNSHRMALLDVAKNSRVPNTPDSSGSTNVRIASELTKNVRIASELTKSSDATETSETSAPTVSEVSADTPTTADTFKLLRETFTTSRKYFHQYGPILSSVAASIRPTRSQGLSGDNILDI